MLKLDMARSAKHDIETLKRRLKRAGISREQVAAHLGVALGSVNHWLSGYRAIPAAKRKQLESMLQNTRGASPFESILAVSVRFTPAEFDRLRDAAGSEMPIDIEDAIREALEEKWGIISGKPAKAAASQDADSKADAPEVLT